MNYNAIHDLAFWVQAAVAVTAMIGVFIGIRTLREIARQTKIASEATVATHRPRIIVRHVFTQDHLEKGLRTISGEFQMANTGGTLATIDAIHAEIYVCAHLPAQPPYKAGETVTIPLAPGESLNRKIAPRPTTLNEEWAVTLDLISKGKYAIYALGFIDYADISGVRRRTAFCRRHDPQTDRYAIVNDPDYEYLD